MRDPRTDDEVLERLHREYAYRFAGWDFSHLGGRCVEYGRRPWDYDEECLRRIRRRGHVVDVDTGDGVHFASFLRRTGVPSSAGATEGYEPNLIRARQILEPFGGRVFEGGGTEPLPPASADLIIDRHGCFDPADTFRALAPGGTWVTEQVGEQTNLEIHKVLGAPVNPKIGYCGLSNCRAQIDAAGLEVERAEEALTGSCYHDAGILLWYLKAISGRFPTSASTPTRNRCSGSTGGSNEMGLSASDSIRSSWWPEGLAEGAGSGLPERSPNVLHAGRREGQLTG